MKKMKRFLSMLLAVAMVFSMLPVNVFAMEYDEAGAAEENSETAATEAAAETSAPTEAPVEETEPEPTEPETSEPEVTEPEATEPTEVEIVVEETVSADTVAADESVIASGTMSDGISWSVSSDYVVTISGTGAMTDSTTNDGPWQSYQSKLTGVVVEEGITSIADWAFCCCSNITSVSLPKSLVNIGKNAFDKCSSLAAVTIPANVSEIEANAFNGCSALTEITIPENVVILGSGAFGSCSGLKEVTIQGACGIGSSAFWYCQALEKLTIEGNVTSIDGLAFADCSSLKQVVLPASVTSIGGSAFSSCVSLQKIVFLGSAPTFGSNCFVGVPAGVYYLSSDASWTSDVRQKYGGDVYWEACTAMGSCGDSVSWTLTTDGRLNIFGEGAMSGYYSSSVPWVNYREQITTVVVEKGVTGIGSYAFHNCANLTSVSIADTVTAVDDSAFQNCAALKKVELPEGVTLIGYNAFNGCSALAQANIPSAIQTIEGYAFSGTALTTATVPGSLTTMGQGIFNSCTALTDVTLESGLTKIGSDLFSGCTALTEVTVPDTVTTFGTGVFWESGVETVNLSANLTAIPTQTFWNCDALEALTIPESVTSIGENAFDDCDALKEIVIPDSVTSIGKYAFESCSGLEKVTIGSGVTSVGLYAFLNCSAMKDLILKDGITTLGTNGFQGCSSLTSVEMPDTIKYVNEYVFYQCESLTTVKLPANASFIGQYAFYDTGLTQVEIPETATSIGRAAFSACEALTSVTIPAGVTHIHDYAFGGTGLKNITFEGTPTSINSTAFSGVTATVHYNAGTGTWTEANMLDYGGTLTWKYNMPIEGVCGENLTWSLTADGTLTISGSGAMTDYYTDSTKYKGYGPPVWFDFRDQITSLVIGDEVTGIGAYAFFNCTNLKKVTMGAGLTYVKPFAFNGCTEITEVYFPSINDWLEIAFRSTQAYPSVGGFETIPSTPFVSATEETVYVNGEAVTEIVIPETFTTVKQGAFVGCDSLTSVTLHDGITSIGYGAFYKCTGLKELELPEALTTVGVNAFGYSGLEKITIPAGVTAQDRYAFSRCSNLTEVRFMGDAPTFGDNVFYLDTAKVLYPAENETWTADNMLSYGGTVTWEPWYEELGSGSCGDNVDWVLTADGKLVISGTGAMEDYFLGAMPWFDYVDQITTLEVQEGVTSIGFFAFAEHTALTRVSLPGTLTLIDECAFSTCTALTELVIPASVTEIRGYAFENCTAMTEITFQGNAMTIGDNIFSGVTATAYHDVTDATWTADVKQPYGGTITWVAVDEEGNPCLALGTCGESLSWKLTPDGVLTISGQGQMANYSDNTMPWYTYNTAITAIVVEEGVTSVGNCAFSNVGAAEVSLPSTLLSIGNSAFQSSALTEAVIPEGVTSIGSSAFSGCNSLTAVTIPGTVTTLRGSEFANNPALTSVTLGEGLTKLSDSMFALCESLETIALPSTLVTIEPYALFDCNALVSVTIPANVTSIGAEAFGFDEALASVTFEGDAPSIDVAAFDHSAFTAYYPAGNSTWTEDTMQSYGGTVTWEVWYEEIASGACSETVNWVLTEDGKLTISGEGAMPDYTSNTMPWYDHKDSITHVAVEAGVTAVGAYAFYEHDSMVSFTLADTVTSIGTYGFAENDALTEIVIPDSVTSLGKAAFNFCTAVTGLTIGRGITDIPELAFGSLHVLTELNIPDTVQTIGGWAFQDMAITSITIPASVTSIGSAAFNVCGKVETITFLGEAPAFAENAFSGITAKAYYPYDLTSWTAEVQQNYGGTLTWIANIPVVASGTCGDSLNWVLKENGVLTISGSGSMTNYGTENAPWYAYNEQIVRIVVGEGVVSIGNCAFEGSKASAVSLPTTLRSIGNSAFQSSALTEVVIPEGVTSIGSSAFSGCNSLTAVTIPGTVTTLRGSEFSNNPALTSVTLGEGLTKLSDTMFGLCTALETIELPSTLVTIEPYALFDCDKLVSVTIPAGVTSIGAEAFGFDEALVSVTFEGDAPSIDAAAFDSSAFTAYYPAGNSTWTEDTMQSYGGTVTWTPVYAVVASGTCGDSLNWVLTEDGVLTISGTGAMTDFTSGKTPWYDTRSKITSVVIEDGVTDIGEYAFFNCTGMTEIRIPAEITDISKYAFSNCRALIAVTIPEGITAIPDYTFASCSTLTAIEIPAAVTQIGANAFYGCSALKEVTFAGNAPAMTETTFRNLTLTAYYPAANETWTEEVLTGSYGGTITWKTYIPVVAEGTCGVGVTWVLRADGSLTISGTGAMTNYSSGTAPWYSFRDQIVSVVIEEGVTGIGDYAFKDFTNLTSVEIPECVTSLGSRAFYGCSALTEVVLPNGITGIPYSVFGKCTSLTKVVIPEGVATIGADAFYKCSALQEITLPDGLTSIGDAAFQACGLTAVALPDSVTSIGISVFQNCKALTDAALPTGLTSIGQSTFSGCSALTSVTIPDSVTSIGSSAFADCASLASVTPWKDYSSDIVSIIIEDGVTAIGAGVFYGCGNLKNVQIADSVTRIENGAFGACGMTEITIPDSVTELGGAFTDCMSLTSITLSKNLTSIGEQAFFWCSALESVTIPASVRSIGDMAFHCCTALQTITFEGNAPVFETSTEVDLGTATSTFTNVTATAYYPEGDATWTSDVMQNYGGNITWTAYEVKLPSASGTCGEQVSWTFDSETGILTVSGTGAMNDYAEGAAPWNDYYGSITGIVIEEGITYIGSHAFYGYTFWGRVEVPSTVESMGSYALVAMECTELYFKGSAPAVQSDTFAGASGYIYYNYSDASFTQEFKDSCGARIVWCPYDTTGTYKAMGGAGQDLIWMLDDNGKLTLVGSGEMEMPYAADMQWAEYWEDITSVEIPEGVTVIRQLGFACLTNVEEMTIPSTVTSVGTHAFERWGENQKIIFTGNAPVIEEDAFYGAACTVCYPADAAGWEAVTANTYGGTITWTAVEEEKPVTSGTCGVTLYWEFDPETGILTIYGVGQMYDYVGTAAVYTLRAAAGEPAPWADWAEDITKIVIEKGVTSVGSYAFIGCGNVEEVTIGVDVESIGTNAFAGCGTADEETALTVTFTGDAPVMDETAFAGTTAAVAYPADNETWTEDTMADYGGAITWEEAAPVVRFNLSGTTMSLGNSLAINFVVNTAKLEGTNNYAVITKEYADGRESVTVTVPQSEWVVYSGNLYYFTFAGVSAKEMNDNVTVVVYNGAGQQMTNTYVDSVAGYSIRAAQKELAKTGCDPEKVTLYVDMVNYGAAAQIYFGYDEANLANAGLTDELKAYASETVEVSDSRVKGEGYLGTTLSLKNEILLNFVFSNAVTENAAYAAVSFTNHYGTAKSIEVPAENFQAYGTSGKYISVTSMSVADCYADLTVTLYDAEGNVITSAVDSVESYIARTINSNALYPEIMKFANAAYNYFH